MAGFRGIPNQVWDKDKQPQGDREAETVTAGML